MSGFVLSGQPKAITNEPRLTGIGFDRVIYGPYLQKKHEVIEKWTINNIVELLILYGV